MTRFLAVIPARGGSKGVPRKNIRIVAGKPLIAWSIEAALQSGVLSQVAVSTEDAEIAEIASQYGATVVDRPVDLAQDNTPTLPVLLHAVKALGFTGDAVMTLQPTSPLRTPTHIREAAAVFTADTAADSLVSVIDVPHIFHPRSVMKIDDQGYLAPYLDGPLVTRRQDKEPVLARNGAAIYITRASCLDRFVFGGRLLAYKMTPEDSLDIDTEDDLIQAERMLALR